MRELGDGWVACLEVPRETPSGNVTRKEHWAKTSQRAQMWRTELAVAMAKWRAELESAQPFTRVHIVSVRKKKLDKFDNLPFGMKEIIPDNLKKMGLILDDSDDYCDITCEQRLVENGEKPKTFVLLGHEIIERGKKWEKVKKMLSSK